VSVLEELESIGILSSGKPKVVPEPVPEPVHTISNANAVTVKSEEAEVEEATEEFSAPAVLEEAAPLVAPPTPKAPVAAPRGAPPALVALKTLKARVETARMALAHLSEAIEDMEPMLRRSEED
jgi:hypothetical protein